MNIERITSNVSGSYIRRESLNGREYLVVPMTMLTEGVHHGSYGALYYPANELAKSPAIWNLKPVMIYHPANGTATDLVELNQRQVGIILNAHFENGRLKAEAWLEPDRLQAIAQEVLAAVNAGRTVEVSTGLYTDNINSPGIWNGKHYEFVALNYKPDHLAILPTGKGACSVTDGCGLLQLNKEHEMTDEEKPLGLPTMNIGPEYRLIYHHHPMPTSTDQPSADAQFVDNAEDAPLGLPEMTWGTDKPCCGDLGATGVRVGNQGGNYDQHPADAQQGGESPLGLPAWQF